jgi:hypothetical protein
MGPVHDNLQQTANRLAETTFLGGPVADFETVGRLQLVTLLQHGLYPWSKMVDIGCGSLRGGFWFIHFLRPGCYHGIEPNRTMLEIGLREIVGEDVVREKTPRFDHNDSFDVSVFGERFDYFLARSIWTHASKAQISAMLDSFVANAAKGAVFLTSYLRASRWSRLDYRGAEWVGRSHQSDKSGLVLHSLRWIEEQCAQRGLKAVELREGVYNNQRWLKITHR